MGAVVDFEGVGNGFGLESLGLRAVGFQQDVGTAYVETKGRQVGAVAANPGQDIGVFRIDGNGRAGAGGA